MSADLHMHSTFSDGSYTPTELVKEAAKIGLKTIALSDHDTVAGVEEAIREGKRHGVNVIPALEFSTFEGDAEIHILGYYIDYKSPLLLNKIGEIFDARIERARGMIKKLRDQGIEISYEDVKNIAGDEYIGRPHIARAMQQAGYIKVMGEAFSDRYIGNGGQAYLPKYKISPEEAIKIINEVGGVAILAHPFFVNHGKPFDKKGIERLVGFGLEGVEVYHSKQNDTQSNYYHKIARELGLLITGGSDFHGENSPGVDLGDIVIENTLVEKLKKYADR